MRIIQYTNMQEIYNRLIDKIKYQKVVLLTDNNQNINKKIEKVFSINTVFYTVSFDSVNLEEFIKDGTKCVILVLQTSNYLKVKSIIDDNMLVVDICSSEYLLRFNDFDNYYLYIAGYKKSVADYLVLANSLVESIWQNLLSFKDVSSQVLLAEEIIQKFGEKESSNFDHINHCLGLKKEISFAVSLDEELPRIKDVSIYLFLRLIAIKYLFLSFKLDNVFMVDIYKECKSNENEINLCYKLLTSERANFLLKNCYDLLIEIIDRFVRKIKINNNEIIKSIKNELKVLKNNAKTINLDNLLKYCYLYGIFNNV